MNNKDKVLLTTMGMLMENQLPDYKKVFQDYCKDRITDLGKIELPDDIWEDEMNTWDIVMTADAIREFSDLRIINNIELNEEDNLIAIDKDNKIVFNTPMLTSIGYAARMEFDKIDKEYYDNLMKYWDDIDMEETMEGYVEEPENLEEDYNYDKNYSMYESISTGKVLSGNKGLSIMKILELKKSLPNIMSDEQNRLYEELMLRLMVMSGLEWGEDIRTERITDVDSDYYGELYLQQYYDKLGEDVTEEIVRQQTDYYNEIHNLGNENDSLPVIQK